MSQDSASSLRTLSATQAAQQPPLLHALWHDAQGNWDRAHEIAQDIDGVDAAWVHAYLHRKEGDSGNAAYWYHRAKKPVCRASLEEEWQHLVHALSKSS